jgi:cytidylate kinase
MSVVTISREFGSEGRSIAEKVAQTLGYHLVDKTTMENVLVQYGFVEFEQEYNVTPGFWARFDTRRTQMVDMLNRIIQALARHGNTVILGRGGFAVLRGFADVLNVRIHAPLPIRVRRVMARQKISERGQAEAIVKENDKVRVEFVQSFYSIHWDAASAFDVVIDTGKVSPELTASWLVDAVQGLLQQTSGEERTARLIQVEPILASVVSSVLGCTVEHD